MKCKDILLDIFENFEDITGLSYVDVLNKDNIEDLEPGESVFNPENSKIVFEKIDKYVEEKYGQPMDIECWIELSDKIIDYYFQHIEELRKES